MRSSRIASSSTRSGYAIASLTYYVDPGPPSPPSPPPSPPLAPTSTSDMILSSGSGTLLQSGVAGGHPTACTMTGGWLSATPVDGILMAASTADSTTGLGTYYCSYQTSAHLKMVKFELTLSSAGDLYAKAVAAAYTSGTATDDAETEWASSKMRSSRIASSSTRSGYAIASLTYYV